MAHVCFQRLQTLFLENSFPVDMLKNFKFLRVLVLIDWEMEELPKSIGKMKHLRYLDIAQTCITNLPGSVTKLYNLQTLKIRYDLDDFPPTFGNLVNLRHLYGGGVLTGVGKLTSLRTLPRFVVSRCKGCLIEQLGGLINLGGKLAIGGLDDIENMEEAQRGRLFEKSKLQSLNLEWSKGGEQEEYVLEGLRPHSNLRSLKIDKFRSVKLPSWMMSESFSALQNLVEIKLIWCDSCEQVPTLGHLPYLKKVVLYGLYSVRKIGIEFYYDSIVKKGEVMMFFPTLKELIVKQMKMLEEWVNMKEVYRSLDVKVFPNLEKLKIFGCEDLLELPNSLQDCVALDEISIEYCFNLKVIPDLQGLTSLQNISIEFCYNLEVIPDLQGLTSLQKISIEYCSNLKVIPDLQGLTSQQKISIEYCDNLKVIPDLQGLTSLQKISIQYCDNLKVIPDLQGLTSLQEISIAFCSNLKVIPDLQGLTSLRELMVYCCSELSDLPRRLETLTSLKGLNIGDCGRVSFVPALECLSTLEYLHLSNLSKEIDELPTLPLLLLSLSLGEWPKLQLSRRQHEPLFNLTFLSLWICEELESVPGWLGNLSSLQRLWINNCKKLRSLAPLSRHTKLEELYIWSCPLLAERCVRGSGKEWHKIQHIPRIMIDDETIQDIKLE